MRSSDRVFFGLGVVVIAAAVAAGGYLDRHYRTGVATGDAALLARAGASVAHEGPCETEGGECGTIVGIPCGAGEFCEMPEDTCGSADLGGTCVAIPEVCTEGYAPVCGCDRVTYANDCQRRGALVAKHHDGACGPSAE